MDSDSNAKSAEVSRAAGLGFQVARLSDHEMKEFHETFERVRRQRMASQGTPAYDKTQALAGGGYGVAGSSSPGWITEELSLDNIDAAMTYQPWDESWQSLAADLVKETLTIAARAILRYVPRSPRRTLALQHLINARMDANAAISFKGRF